MGEFVRINLMKRFLFFMLVFMLDTNIYSDTSLKQLSTPISGMTQWRIEYKGEIARVQSLKTKDFYIGKDRFSEICSMTYNGESYGYEGTTSFDNEVVARAVSEGRLSEIKKFSLIDYNDKKITKLQGYSKIYKFEYTSKKVWYGQMEDGTGEWEDEQTTSIFYYLVKESGNKLYMIWVSLHESGAFKPFYEVSDEKAEVYTKQ